MDQVFVETELESGLRPDVQIQHKGKPTLAIEIKVTHEVDDAKRSRLTLPWIELDAEAIIRDPHKWSPRQHNVSKVDQCAFCLQVDKERLVQTLAKDLRQWVMWWRNKFGKYPYVSDEIEHRQRTLTRLMRAQATSWKNRTGQELPGVLTIWGETTTLI